MNKKYKTNIFEDHPTCVSTEYSKDDGLVYIRIYWMHQGTAVRRSMGFDTGFFHSTHCYVDLKNRLCSEFPELSEMQLNDIILEIERTILHN